jgi:hypothetical protein
MNAPSTIGRKVKQTAFAAFVLVTCIYTLCHTTSISFAIASLSMALIAGWVAFIIWTGKNQPLLRNAWLITQLILVMVVCWPNCGLNIYWLAGGLLLSTISLTKKRVLPGTNAFHSSKEASAKLAEAADKGSLAVMNPADWAAAITKEPQAAIIYWKESPPNLRLKIETILGTTLAAALPVGEAHKSAQALGRATEAFLSEAS